MKLSIKDGRFLFLAIIVVAIILVGLSIGLPRNQGPTWQSAAFKQAINNWAQTPPSLGSISNCSGVKDSDYDVEGPFDLTDSGNQDYLVLPKFYCGDVLGGGDGGGTYLVLEKATSSYENIGELFGHEGWNLVQISNIKVNGYRDIVTTDIESQMPILHLWQWNPASSTYGDVSELYHYSVGNDGLVHYREIAIKEADKETFVDLYGSGFAKDKNHVYYLGKIEPFDSTTFDILDPYAQYVKDKNGAYTKYYDPNGDTYGQLKVADFKTLQYIGSGYLKDSVNVYAFDDPIKGADPDTITVLPSADDNSGYAKDKTFVYYKGKIVSGADPSTFSLASTTSVLTYEYSTAFPNALILVDAQGRRTGRDTDGHTYGEIPSATYYQNGACQEGTGCDFIIDVSQEPNQPYTLYVIRGGIGSYGVFATIDGSFHYTQFVSSTFPDDAAMVQFASNPNPVDVPNLGLLTFQGAESSTVSITHL